MHLHDGGGARVARRTLAVSALVWPLPGAWRCWFLGEHQPDWVLGVMTADTAREAARPVCLRCRSRL